MVQNDEPYWTFFYYLTLFESKLHNQIIGENSNNRNHLIFKFKMVQNDEPYWTFFSTGRLNWVIGVLRNEFLTQKYL